MGTIFVDNLEPQSGTSLTLGASGDTVGAASGVINNLSKKYKEVLTEECLPNHVNSKRQWK